MPKSIYLWALLRLPFKTAVRSVSICVRKRPRTFGKLATRQLANVREQKLVTISWIDTGLRVVTGLLSDKAS